jgi:catechol 2,3-dioxygenase-like lactoylglutathione lyase family enzyme
MGLLKVDSVVHWSIPVNDLEESEKFYRDVLGLTYRGRLGNSCMYFLDPSGNLLELCDPTWKPGMPTPTYEEIVDA